MSAIKVSVIVPHDKSHAWEYYFNQTNGWWPKDFYPSPHTKRFIIDTYIGGKAYEDFGGVGGLIWGDVIGVDYINSLQIRGTLARAFGGPNITLEKFSFEEEDGQTTVTYTCDFIGEVSEKTIQSLQTGWESILNDHYKKYCLEREHK